MSARRIESKRVAARCFDRAVRACGYTNATVGALLELDEKRVRRLRSDDDADLDVVPSVADVLMADHALGEAFVRELRAERRRIHGEPSTVTVERQLAGVLVAASGLMAAGASALADGAVSGPERAALDQQAAHCEGELGALRAQLRGGTR